MAQRTEELQKANETLDEQRSQLRLILDNTVEGISGLDLKMNCTFCNESCLRLLGYSRPEDLVGKGLLWLIHHSFKHKDPLSEYLSCREAGHAAEALKENCRSGDIAARVGEDEFCVLLPQTKLDEAKRHSEEVGRLCGEMGAEMGLPESEIKMLKNAGYLHDIGKVALSGGILGKGQMRR